MSKKNRRINQNRQENRETPETGKERRSIRQFCSEKYHKVMATKGGRITVRVLKGVGLAGFGFGCYTAGKKSKVPVVMVHPVEEAETNEPVEEETATEEQIEEKTEE